MDNVQNDKLAAAFKECLDVCSNTESNLAGAVRHAMSNPGSMARARLCYLVGNGWGLREDAATNLALAAELFHSASLLFDDLPAMDDAAERRGVACAHIIYGDGVAMLAALALINRAYALLWAAMQEASSGARAEAAHIVESWLGIRGILNGQSHDLHFNASGCRSNRVLRVALGKTVSLVRMSLVLPAIIAGAPPKHIRILNRLSVFWGLAYQIMDDLKDVLKSTSEAKKTTQRDALLGRPNLAIAEGPAKTSALLSRLIWLGESTLERAAADSPLFEMLREFQRKVADECLQLNRAPV
jgi:geranylgeranyl pyrophosphate synthase